VTEQESNGFSNQRYQNNGGATKPIVTAGSI